jgi:hypothetical protein
VIRLFLDRQVFLQLLFVAPPYTATFPFPGRLMQSAFTVDSSALFHTGVFRKTA